MTHTEFIARTVPSCEANNGRIRIRVPGASTEDHARLVRELQDAYGCAGPWWVTLRHYGGGRRHVWIQVTHRAIVWKTDGAAGWYEAADVVDVYADLLEPEAARLCPIVEAFKRRVACADCGASLGPTHADSSDCCNIGPLCHDCGARHLFVGCVVCDRCGAGIDYQPDVARAVRSVGGVVRCADCGPPPDPPPPS